jgi:hypothetical protein
MTEKLFAGLRTVFGSRPDFNRQIEQWARTEYGTDWHFAYDQIIKTGNPPIKGIDY